MIERATTPRRRTVAAALLAVYWLALMVSTHWPIPPELLRFGHSDKLVHLIAYSGLALLLCVNWALRRPLGWPQGLAIVAIVAVLAAADELTQPPFNRACESFDWVADMTGAVVGVVAFVGATALLARPREPMPGAS